MGLKERVECVCMCVCVFAYLSETVEVVNVVAISSTSLAIVFCNFYFDFQEFSSRNEIIAFWSSLSFILFE